MVNRMKKVVWMGLGMAGLVILGVLISGCSGVNLSPFATATPTPTPIPPPTATSEAAVDCQPTPGQFTSGFLEEFPPRVELAPPEMPGERIEIAGTIYASDCITPLPGAILQVWHADSQGEYDRTEPYDLAGQIHADESGQYKFSSIRPAGYGPGEAPRPAHIHALVTINDGRVLATQMFFADDPVLINSGLPPALLIELEPKGGTDGSVKYGTFDIVLPVAPPTPAPDVFTDEDL